MRVCPYIQYSYYSVDEMVVVADVVIVVVVVVVIVVVASTTTSVSSSPLVVFSYPWYELDCYPRSPQLLSMHLLIYPLYHYCHHSHCGDYPC